MENMPKCKTYFENLYINNLSKIKMSEFHKTRGLTEPNLNLLNL